MKREWNKFFLVAGLAAAAAGCGDTSKSTDAPSTDGDLQGREYLTLEGDNLDTSEGILSGSGQISFLKPNSEAAASYALRFRLDDGGSLTLLANAEVGLKNGIAIKFTRASEKLQATVEAAGKSVDVSYRFTTVDASSELDLLFDIHNHESPAHILIWSSEAKPTDENAVYDSEADTRTPGQGNGYIWGLTLDRATVLAADTAEAKFSH